MRWLYPARVPADDQKEYLHPGFPELVKGNRKLLESGQGADFTVTCGNQKWNLHQAIVSSQSEFFAKALDSGFKESITRSIVIDHEEPAMICRMLKYLYLFDYSHGVEDIIPGMEDLSPWWRADLSASRLDSRITPHQLEVNARMYVLADMYGINSLKKVAQEKFDDVKPTTGGLPRADFKEELGTSKLDPGYFVDVLIFIWENTHDEHDRLRMSAKIYLIKHRNKIHWNGELERLASTNPECAGALIDLLIRSLNGLMHRVARGN